MKKKIIFVGLAVLVGLIFYFFPLSLKNRITKTDVVLVSTSIMDVRDGEPYMDIKAYNDLSKEQMLAIIDLLKTVSYTRTLDTLFSDGEISGDGNYMYLLLYRDNELVNSICLTQTGKISIDNKAYQMQNSKQIMEQITEICNSQ